MVDNSARTAPYEQTGKLANTNRRIVAGNRRNKRDLILSAAAHLFAEYGYHGTTMDSLSDETKLNKGTLYYYYSTKTDILFDICVTTTEHHLKAVSKAAEMKDPMRALLFVIEASVNYIVGNRASCQVYYQEEEFFESIFNRKQFQRIRRQQKAFMTNLSDVLDRGIATGQFRAVNVRMCAKLIYGAILGPYRWPDPDLDREAIIREILSLVAGGIQGKPSAAKDKVQNKNQLIS